MSNHYEVTTDEGKRTTAGGTRRFARVQQALEYAQTCAHRNGGSEVKSLQTGRWVMTYSFYDGVFSYVDYRGERR